MHSGCVRLSHHLQLSLTLLPPLSLFLSLFLSPSSYTLTFISPPPPSVSLSLSPSLCVSCRCASLSFSICTLSFLAPTRSACHSRDAYLSFSLFFTISLDLWLPLWPASCLFLFSLTLYVPGCVSLSASSSHSPPLRLHYCI